MWRWLWIGWLIPGVALGADDLRQAQKMYESMEYKAAATASDKALRSSGMRPEELIEAYRIQGLSLSILGKTEASAQAFMKLLSIDPTFRLSRDISPKVSAPFNQALSLSKEAPGIVVKHGPPSEIPQLGGAQLQASIDSDPMGLIAALRLRYRLGPAEDDKTLTTKAHRLGLVVFTLPGGLRGEGLEYHIEALNAHGGVLVRVGSPDSPFRVSLARRAPAIIQREEADREEESEVAQVDIGALALDRPSLVEKKASDLSSGKPWYKTWWFWTTVGVVVVGATVGTVLAIQAARSGDTVDYVISIPPP